jgi:hypothetical protein
MKCQKPIVDEAEVSEPMLPLPEVLVEVSEVEVVDSPLLQAVKAPMANTKK